MLSPQATHRLVAFWKERGKLGIQRSSEKDPTPFSQDPSLFRGLSITHKYHSAFVPQLAFQSWEGGLPRKTHCLDSEMKQLTSWQ